MVLQLFILYTILWNMTYVFAWSLFGVYKYFIMPGVDLKSRYGAGSYAVITG